MIAEASKQQRNERSPSIQGDDLNYRFPEQLYPLKDS